MRNQLEELVKLAKQLRETVKVNDLPQQTIHISTSIRVNKVGTTFHSVSFLQGTTTLDVNLYQEGEYNNNVVNISLEKLSDIELDEIILRSKEDIANFIAKLDTDREQRRLDKINELKNKLAELEGNVPTN